MIAPTPHEEETVPEPWMTMAEGAEHARCLGADGDPTDRFYAVVKRHLGNGSQRRLVRASELDKLIEEGKL